MYFEVRIFFAVTGSLTSENRNIVRIFRGSVGSDANLVRFPDVGSLRSAPFGWLLWADYPVQSIAYSLADDCFFSFGTVEVTPPGGSSVKKDCTVHCVVQWSNIANKKFPAVSVPGHFADPFPPEGGGVPG